MPPGSSPPQFDFSAQSRNAVALALARAALEAGPAVMEEYSRGIEARTKADGSPVTAADERAEAIIRARLNHLAPTTPIVAEEAAAAGAPLDVGARFFLVDPLDGTKEFISRNGEFTINIALIEAGWPVAGAVYAPAQSRLWFAGETAYVCEGPVGGYLPDESAWRKLRTRAAPARLVALASRSHCDPQTEAFLAGLPIAERKSAGSSLKFCVIAEGGADVYPRFAPTMEWDTAAGDAVLRAAGGIVLRLDGAPLDYGKIGARLCNGGFVAWGDKSMAERRARA
jgi:3'(2'), 5'-bisphosphate nucleotidase